MRNGAFRLVSLRKKKFTPFLLNTGEDFLLNTGVAFLLNGVTEGSPSYPIVPYFLLNSGASLKLNSGKKMILSEV